MEGRSTRALYLTDHRKHVSCMAVGKGLDGRCGCYARFSQLRTTERESFLQRGEEVIK